MSSNYAIVCLLPDTAAGYQRRLIEEVAARFDLPFTLEHDIPPHFTLKYEFETDRIASVEELINEFCAQYRRAPVEIGEADCFAPDVAFLAVKLSSEARAIFESFVERLRALPWMTWRPHDAENLRFHATVAEECGEKLEAVMDFLRGREHRFSISFDNITVLRQTEVRDGMDRWVPHRRFSLPQ